MRGAIVGLFPDAYWAWRVRQRGWEEPELALLDALVPRDQTAVDVGANYGMYTHRLVQLSRRCIAFEPNARLAAMLRRGYRSRIDVHQVALSDHAGTARLRVPELDTGYGSIEPGNALKGHRRVHELEVPMRRLDDFELTDVGFIKIDVEGHEEAVLAGAVATLERWRPSLLLELEERHNTGCISRVVALLNGHGYTGVTLHQGVLRSLDAFDPVTHQAEVDSQHYARNFIFVARERTETMAALKALVSS
jgi:FkbM family methyltransferase